jgi:two-component system chemotaxis sensor kinase CheA
LTGDCRDRVGALAEALVLAEVSDLQALGDLHSRFKAIGESLDGEYAREAASLCALAQAALERIIMGDTQDAGSEMDRVGGCVVCLQGLLCEGRAPGELPMPAELHGSGPAAQANPASLEEADVPDADAGLTADFVRESLEHLENSDVLLMSLESDPADREAVNGLFRAFHTIKGVAGFLGFKSIQAFAHGTENLLDLVRQGSLAMDTRIIDVAFAAVDVLRRRMQWAATRGGQAAPDEIAAELRAVLTRVEAAAEGRPDAAPAPALPPAEPGMRLGEILMAAGTVPPEAMEAALRAQAEARERPLGETLVKETGIPAKEVGLALRSQKLARDTQVAQVAAVKETVKVEAERLDRLLDAIGELVIAETMIFQSRELKGMSSPALSKQMVALDKITRELQKMGTSLRMIPIRPVFQKMAKLARDLAKKSGKNVEFQCFGEDTELDKTVVDKIGDPLVHMVRNSVDHGIEPDAAARAAAGKPAQAKVVLRAFQKGGSVCIQVEDDGKGLNRESILRKARERGMIADDGSALSDPEVWAFIFEAGFSTAAQVTEVSGRGVGMDVVRRNIEELRGRIEIDSRAGKGTTFSIWLPLTMAIIDGMIVRVRGQRLIFPTLSILRIVPLRPEETRAYLERGEMMLMQGELIPLFNLAEYVPGGHTDAADRALAVIVECGARKAGLLVDELLGQQQVVVKGLGESLKHLPGVSGGAILSDGTVGMILDVDGLLQSLRAAPAAA